MAKKIFNYNVRAQSDLNISPGTSSFLVSDVSNFRAFSTVVSTTQNEEDRFTYKLTASNNTLKWEYGVGYITTVGGQSTFSRETVHSSSNSNAKVSFSSDGNLVVDLIDNNPNFVNTDRISSTSTLDNVSSTYFIDAASNVTLNLPDITTESAQIGLTITSLSGSETERANAVTLTPSGSNTISSGSSYVLTKKNDFVRIVSDVTNTNWIVLDPISDTAASAGIDGAIQIASGNVLGSDTSLNFSNNTLFIGGTGTNNSPIQLSSNGSTFNALSGSLDFAIHSTASPNTFFVDGSTNKVGLKTNLPLDTLDVHVTGSEGVTVTTTGSNGIPSMTVKNLHPSFVAGDDIGHINFVALDSAGFNNTYARVVSEAIDKTAGSEDGLLNLQISYNGNLQTVAQLTYDDVNIGTSNSVTGGVVIGSSNTNKGQNVVLGYFSTNCGTSSVSLGNSNTIHSGSFGGVVGKNHAITGSDIWVFGGSGANITGMNSVYLLSNSNNYIQLKSDQQNRACVYVDSTGTNFDIKNTRVSTTGVQHKQAFMFTNNSGILVTGVSFGVEVTDPTHSSEDTKFVVDVMSSGTQTNVLSVDGNSVNISNITGLDNSVLVGSNLAITGGGDHVTVVGLTNTISNNSGEITIVGYNNDLTSSGNDHIVAIGTNNSVDENYSTTIGTSNKNSGLYSAVVGYNNGAYGENVSVVGVNNDASGNNIGIVGYNNNVDNNQVYILGQGNTSAYTGVQMIGSSITAAANNTAYIKNTNVVIDATTVTLTGTTVNIDATFGGTGLNNFIQAGNNISLLNNNSNYLASGGNVSHLTNDSNYVTSGDNISNLTNDVNFLTVPKITFDIEANHLNTQYHFSGGGTQGSGIDQNPTIYVYRGFTYAFSKTQNAHPFQIQQSGSAYTSGLTNNTGVTSGIVTWSVRHDAPESGLYYICTSHSAMSGNFIVAK